ncbi:PREDICTED: protein ECT2-like [Rhagoletis zephyria]|uniref:protein ECT2-like n=1 Tax=Rhagoletis zephyria TaxID=28612 RepID=UPI0008117395|nr:PREDICTED: protein ECT2-like [Rhagoletis zephyria]
MKNFVICFSTTDKRQTIMINRYLNLIRFMAGQSRRDMKTGRSFDRTHLIETTTESDNYKLAVIYGIPILKKEWIDVVWKQRRNVNFCATNNAEVEAPHRLKPFTRLQISLYNYTSEEEAELRQAVLKNGGKVLPVGETIAEGCTHLVVKIVQQDLQQAEVSSLIEGSAHLPKYVVTDKWLTLCLETLTREDESGCRLKVPGLLNFSATMGGHHFNYNSCTPSKGDDSIAHHTMSSLLLSPNYDKSFDEVNTTVDKADLKKQAITQELYQTEMNYVTILKDVLKIFHEPLKNPRTPGELPNEIELKTMFGGLPPIIEVHEQILRELEPVVANWKAENEVGKIFQKHSKTFLTVYPQYINFFEQTKEMIETCKLKYPCFSKFIRASQLNAECKKQTFQELLINPIQRLPRIEMYLREQIPDVENAFVMVSHPSDCSSHFSMYPFVVTKNSEMNKQKFVAEILKAYDALKDQDTDSHVCF